VVSSDSAISLPMRAIIFAGFLRPPDRGSVCEGGLLVVAVLVAVMATSSNSFGPASTDKMVTPVRLTARPVHMSAPTGRGDSLARCYVCIAAYCKSASVIAAVI
jgi:hypothetical protein